MQEYRSSSQWASESCCSCLARMPIPTICRTPCLVDAFSTHNTSAPTAIPWQGPLCIKLHLLQRPGCATRYISAFIVGCNINTHVCFRVHLHLGHQVVVFHIFLANFPAVFYNLNSFAQIVTLDGPALDGGFGHKCDRCLGDVSLPRRA